MFQSIGDFIISAWLWNIVFDWYYPIVSGIIMFFMMRIIMRSSRTKSLLVVFCTQFFSYIMLGLIAVVLLQSILQWELAPLTTEQAIGMMNSLTATISLSFCYFFLQMLYFCIGRIFMQYNMITYTIILAFTNALSVAINYMLIQMAVFWQYAFQ